MGKTSDNTRNSEAPANSEMSVSSSFASGTRITLVGAVVNILLAAFKITIGKIGHSRALIADGIHSLSDLVTDIVVLFGLHFGNLPADQNHHYGHKKIETVTEIVLGLLLIVVAVKLAYDSVLAIWLKKIVRPTSFTIVAALVSIVCKEWLYRWTRNIGLTLKSRVITANAWHHRTDAYSSIAVLVGLLTTQLSPRLSFMDAVASLVVSAMVAKVGWGIAGDGLRTIIDTAPPKSYIEETLELIRKFPGVKNPHNLKMRYIGSAVHMEVHIEVDPHVSVRKGHDIAGGLKHMIIHKQRNVIDVIVHVEPARDS